MSHTNNKEQIVDFAIPDKEEKNLRWELRSRLCAFETEVHNKCKEDIATALRDYKFQIYKANTVLMAGDTVLSEVRSEDNLIKAEDLHKAIEQLCLSHLTPSLK